MLHYLNGIGATYSEVLKAKRNQRKTKRLKKRIEKKLTKLQKISPITASTINKGMKTEKGQIILAKSPSGRKIVKLQKLKEAGKISPKLAQAQIKSYAKSFEVETQGNDLLDRMNKAVTNELIKDINETPAPEFTEQEEAQDVEQGIKEVNDPEFDTPGSPDDETTGADGDGNIGKTRTWFPTIKRGKKVGVKKIALAPVRGAFLSLVKLNVFKLADKLAKVYGKNKNAVLSLWLRFGGQSDKLIKAINTKKTRIASVGSLTGVAAIIGAAAPILIEVIKLFKKENIPSNDIETATQEATTKPVIEEQTDETIGYNYY